MIAMMIFFLITGTINDDLGDFSILNIIGTVIILELYTYHRRVPAGNATLVTLLVNGRPVLQRDFGPRNPDYVRHVTPLRELHKRDLNLYRWRIPLGEFAGRTVLVSFRVDNKNELNCDSQCFSMPEVISDPSGKVTEEIVAVQAGSVPGASRKAGKK